MAVWVTLCVISVELTSFPFVYGWPLLVIAFGGGLPPPAWAVFVDFLAACIAIGATVLVALTRIAHGASSERRRGRGARRPAAQEFDGHVRAVTAGPKTRESRGFGRFWVARRRASPSPPGVAAWRRPERLFEHDRGRTVDLLNQ